MNTPNTVVDHMTTTLAKEDVSQEFLEAVESAVGTGFGAWDMVDPREIVVAVLTAASRFDFSTATANERLRAALFGPQKQPASVRQIEAQAKSAANHLADVVQAQSRDLTSKPHGAAGE